MTTGVISSGEKRATLVQLLQAKSHGYKIFPLSFAQQRLWFLDQLQRGSPVYHVAFAYRLKGELDSAVLERSLNEIVRRHETLRTTFPAVDGQPVQIIAPGATVKLASVELGHVEQREAEVLQQAIQEVKRPFDLAQGPLLRARLLRLSEDEHVLVLSIHHIIFDGWSMGIFYRELTTLYEAYLQGKPSPLPELPIQYADYAAWEHKWLQGEALQAELAYWKQRLAGAPAALEIPTDYPRPAVETFRGAYATFTLPSKLVAEIKELSQREGVTLFMTLLAAFQMLLARYSMQSDIIVGTDVANRNRVELENLIGFFVNQLVLRTDFSGNPSLSELLQRIREVVLGAYDHQNVPFDQLVRTLNPIRLPNRAPVFQVKLVLQNSLPPARSSAITIDPLLIDAGAAQIDLILDVTETASGFRETWQYNTDLFDVSTIQRMSQHFSALLKAFVASPSHTLQEFNTVLDKLEIPGEDERHVLLRDLAKGRQDVLKQGCLPHEFEEQVRRTPHNIACIMQDRELTYAELNARANKLAHFLKRLGVKAETMVALCTERSLETIIGLLGICKAGGVCVPLDPAYPRERREYILKDSQSTIVVAQEKLASLFREHGLEFISLETIEALLEDEENPIHEIEPEHLAYVMYTSGSTGQPKGVGVSHQVALNHFLLWQREFNLSEQDRMLQFASFSFDASLEQTFPALFCGATVVMRGQTSWSGAELNKTIAEQELTFVNLTHALWQQWSQEMLAEPDAVRPTRLRLVVIGGEAMTLEALRRWRKTPLAMRRLFNAYGPTEAAITATVFEVLEQFCEDGGINTVPIGRPLVNRDIYILDRQGKAATRGSAGEMYIGGPLLARGYLNRPDLTAERFIPNPFSAIPGERLYRTNDLGRYLPDGTIEYLGRCDQQVKIRGFRIELGEIETVLQEHPGVRTAIVLAREDLPGEKRLVAYVHPEQGHCATITELRSFLENRLPEYMIPSAFLRLDSLPLTANGKVDRRALPAPDASRPDVVETFVAPTTPAEETLAQIWREVLALDQVGIHDNFFALGGHSLVAIKVIARMRVAFQVNLPVHVLFQEPTIARLAAKISEAADASYGLTLPTITRLRRDSGARSGSV